MAPVLSMLEECLGAERADRGARFILGVLAAEEGTLSIRLPEIENGSAE